MKKQDIINKIAVDHELSKKEATEIFNLVFDQIVVGLKKDKKTGKVQIPGFGTFTAKKRAARTGHNPSTGEKIKIPAKYVVTFKASKSLLDELN